MHNQKKFAVFDLDGTLFRSSLYFEVVKELIRKGKINQESGKLISDAFIQWRETSTDQSFWNYVDVIMGHHQQNLPNLVPADFDNAVQVVYEAQKNYVHLYPKQLLATLRKQGYLLFAISGSQQEIVEVFCKHHGFDDWSGSIQERDPSGSAFTGNMSITHLDKKELLKSLVAKHGATYEGSVGIGDTQGDATILEMVETPIAFNPSSKLYKHAKTKGWKLVFERKDVIVMLEKTGDTYQLV